MLDPIWNICNTSFVYKCPLLWNFLPIPVFQKGVACAVCKCSKQVCTCKLCVVLLYICVILCTLLHIMDWPTYSSTVLVEVHQYQNILYSMLSVQVYSVIVYVFSVMTIVCIIALACCPDVRRNFPLNLIFLGIFVSTHLFLLTNSVFGSLQHIGRRINSAL